MSDQGSTEQHGEQKSQLEDRQALVEAQRVEMVRDTVRSIAVTHEAGGVAFDNMLEVMEFSKLMARAEEGVPKHLRGKPGMCLAVCVQAREWEMSPFSVANKSYVVNDRLAYESQLIHAVIEARAPITGRLQFRFEGNGDEMICIVFATFKGETDPREWPVKNSDGKYDEGYRLKNLRPEKGGSPLWWKKASLQMFYNVSRDWARVYCTDVLLGIYSKDELLDHPLPGPDGARDITPAADGDGDDLHRRLMAAQANGDHADEGYQEGSAEAELKKNGHSTQRARAPKGGGGGGAATGQPAQGTPTGGHGIAGAVASGGGGSGPPANREPSGSGPGVIATSSRGVSATFRPTDIEEYEAWLTGWLRECQNTKSVLNRWKDEMKLRKACGLDIDKDVNRLRSGIVAERLKELDT